MIELLALTIAVYLGALRLRKYAGGEPRVVRYLPELGLAWTLVIALAFVVDLQEAFKAAAQADPGDRIATLTTSVSHSSRLLLAGCAVQGFLLLVVAGFAFVVWKRKGRRRDLPPGEGEDEAGAAGTGQR